MANGAMVNKHNLINTTLLEKNSHRHINTTGGPKEKNILREGSGDGSIKQ
jgi:hypothetical protein